MWLGIPRYFIWFLLSISIGKHRKAVKFPFVNPTGLPAWRAHYKSKGGGFPLKSCIFVEKYQQTKILFQ